MRVLHVASGRLYGGVEQMLVTIARERAATPEVEALFAVAAPGRLAEALTTTGARVQLLGDVRLSRPGSIVRARAGLRALIDGNVGKIKDFYVFRSQFVSKLGDPLSTKNLAFTKDAIGLVTRRLPQPLPGTGAIAEYAEMGNFGVRVLMSYAPNTLAQQFTVDVLYGCAVLRNSHGVQVQS